jgi:hypothetical protein
MRGIEELSRRTCNPDPGSKGYKDTGLAAPRREVQNEMLDFALIASLHMVTESLHVPVI